MSSIRVVIADGDPLAAEGVAERVRSLDGLEVVGIVDNGRALLERMADLDPGLVIMEVSMPGMDGIDTMRAIHRIRPDLPVLAFSTLCSIEYINSMRTEGAAGYLLKHGPADELGKAITTILSGQEYLSEEAAREVERGYRFTSKELGGEYIGLTERE
ncbi:MAG: response regulator transcription factor, partial [Flavobacteriales bacterium]|nr:response regulator transcription factor [Flavobacteriales bacterium]